MAFHTQDVLLLSNGNWQYDGYQRSIDSCSYIYPWRWYSCDQVRDEEGTSIRNLNHHHSNSSHYPKFTATASTSEVPFILCSQHRRSCRRYQQQATTMMHLYLNTLLVCTTRRVERRRGEICMKQKYLQYQRRLTVVTNQCQSCIPPLLLTMTARRRLQEENALVTSSRCSKPKLPPTWRQYTQQLQNFPSKDAVILDLYSDEKSIKEHQSNESVHSSVYSPNAVKEKLAVASPVEYDELNAIPCPNHHCWRIDVVESNPP